MEHELNGYKWVVKYVIICTCQMLKILKLYSEQMAKINWINVYKWNNKIYFNQESSI